MSKDKQNLLKIQSIKEELLMFFFFFNQPKVFCLHT